MKKEALEGGVRHCRAFIAVTMVCVGCAVAAYGQQPQLDQLPAPPPLAVIPREERTQLGEIKDPKDRSRAEVDFAQAHLTQAEQFTAQGNFERATEQIGYYMALIQDNLHFLSKLNSNTGRVRDLYRRLDIALRAHIPRLSLMRRSTPAAYAVNIKAAEEYDKNARGEALDSFYGPNSTHDDPLDEKKDERSGLDKTAPEKATNEPPRAPAAKHP